MSFLTGLRCIRCGKEFPVEPRFDGCPDCRSQAPSNLTPTYDYEALRRAFRKEDLRDRPLTMWRYHEFLPCRPDDPSSLGEGMTPLIDCPTLGAKLGAPRLHLKDESRNPTGSFKDRLAASALAMAGRFGARTVGVSSTGNAGAAAAAYSARKGLPCVVLTVKGAASAMVTQIRAYGALVAATEKMEDRWTLLETAIVRLGWYPTSPFFGPPIGSNPFGVDGYKTIAYEICEQLDWRAPDWCVLPVAYGDALFGMWKGFDEFAEMGIIRSRPRMVAAETAGSLGAAMREGVDAIPAKTPHSPSVAGSINVAQSTYQALFALKASGGLASTVGDDELLGLQAELAAQEGLYAEPSSLAALAAIRRLRGSGEIREDETVVALITAGGLKDPDATASRHEEIPVVSGDLDELLEALRGSYAYET
ncbi:MAG: pyridoxal-phosphate dependent enzyme [Nitrospinota bacterium]